MHELSLCHAIRGVVEKARDQRPVTTIHMQVGQLRQVVPETLSYCWGLVSEATGLAGSRLDIDHVPVTLSCRTCSAGTAVDQVLILTCSSCGSGDVDVLTGEEFMVTSIDLGPTTGAVASPPEKEESNG